MNKDKNTFKVDSITKLKTDNKIMKCKKEFKAIVNMIFKREIIQMK